MKKIVETERLVLAEAEVKDYPFFRKLLNSPNWIQFIGDRGVKTNQQAKDYIKSNLIASYKNNGYGLYKMCLKSSLEPIGICGLVKRDYLDDPDIGFAILPEQEGKGYTHEASLSILAYGKEKLKLPRILAITTDENIGSQKLIRKIGLLENGTIKPKTDKEEYLLFST
ncbi:GNAT family N-acetyltransferase [Flagellimonas pacifica]|uniref:Protein N-acetyltransferase, RimJ/RimL family n=1 Tax=Flagellimonas pacifica TaxID=1247520 RepID=A0A285MV13_9FLAO|nr:GNAT family N-acetyltransferase [Allomuricauda parva]SNZ00377.1 Protein N-acetyltransferase, RimJ/RimL family [Allomuricauda parva]